MYEELAYTVIGCVMKVYNNLGPGLLESVYQNALMIELDNALLKAEKEVPIEIEYEGSNLGVGFRIDILVENKIVLELKSVSQLEKVHFKQLRTYLKLTNMPLGYLINFNSDSLRIGHEIHRLTNSQYTEE